MDKKIKVYLQYPWKFPDSSYYKNMLDYPPKGVSYLNYSPGEKKFEIIGSSKKFERMRKFKNFLRKILNFIRLPNLVYSHSGNADLIHCAHCLTLNNKRWVVDTEVYDRVTAGGGIAYSWLGRTIIKNRLKSPRCRRIIAWSEDCKKSFEKAFPRNPEILRKLVIVPFALPAPKFKKIKSKNVRLLFVARWFDAKGGRQTLHVMNELTKKYPNVEATFICPTPSEFRKKYAPNRKIKILELMPQEKLFTEVYPAADIFLYPGFGDSYGFAMPEALAYGLPIVTVDSFARREIIRDGRTGFIVRRPKKFSGYGCMDPQMLLDLEEKTCLLIENKKLREKMAKIAMSEVVSGKFSIKKRNDALRKIYEEALR